MVQTALLAAPHGTAAVRHVCLRHRRRVRLGVVSDTHGAVDPRLVAALDDCDAVIHAGDIGDAAVLASLARRERPVIAVRGNNDVPAKWPRGQARVVRALPVTACVELPGGILVIVHGDRVMPATRRHTLLRRLYPTVHAIVYGHSHRLNVDQCERPWVLNPGAAGAVRTYGGPSCLVLEALAAGWRVDVMRFAPVRDARA